MVEIFGLPVIFLRTLSCTLVSKLAPFNIYVFQCVRDSQHQDHSMKKRTVWCPVPLHCLYQREQMVLLRLSGNDH